MKVLRVGGDLMVHRAGLIPENNRAQEATIKIPFWNASCIKVGQSKFEDIMRETS